MPTPAPPEGTITGCVADRPPPAIVGGVATPHATNTSPVGAVADMVNVPAATSVAGMVLVPVTGGVVGADRAAPVAEASVVDTAPFTHS